MVLAHFREIAQAADVPVNADFEGGYADDPRASAENVRLCVETGVAGLSIEDFTGDDADPLYDFDLAVERVKAARDAIDKAGGGVVFTARTEGFIQRPARYGRDHPPAEGLRRCRRRLPLFAGHQDARADRGDGQGGRAEADQFSQQRRLRLHRQGSRRHWACAASASAARWRASPCTPSSSRRREIAKDGKFDSFAGVMPNAELNTVFQRRPRETPSHDDRTPPANRPADRLAGRYHARATSRPGHAARPLRPRRKARAAPRGGLVDERSPGTTTVWTYISTDGPFRDAPRNFPPLSPSARRPTTLTPMPSSRRRPRPRLFHADGNPPRHARDRGRPRALFAGAATHAARHRGAISAGALCLRDARLPPLRMEMQCAQRGLAACRAALWLYL